MRFCPSKVVIKTSIIFLIITLTFSSVLAPAPGSIWTTKDDCGDVSQDVNHYAIGEDVWINGANFAEDTYDWKISGLPGGASCDPNIIVASGTVGVNSSGSFCFDAYTVAIGDCGEYKVAVDNKQDNYRVTFDVFSCSDYTNEEDCEYFTDCDWCPECDGKKWSGGSDRCVDVGTCNYDCVVGYCGAECEPGQPGDRCLPEGSEVYTCINHTSYEIPEYDSCTDACVWDNCETKVVTEDDPRCVPLEPPTCSGRTFGSCWSFEIPTFNFERPSYDFEMPSFNFEIPTFNFETPTFDFPTFGR